MLHDLTLVDGGSHPKPVDPRVRSIAEGNLVHILRPSGGFRPPRAKDVLDSIEADWMADHVRELASAVLPVFAEMTGERWAGSHAELGFWLSLSKGSYDPEAGEGLRRRMGIPLPEWTLRFRERQGEGVRYHVHLPPYVGERVVVAIARVWGAESRLRGVRNLVTFERSTDGWQPVDHVDTRPRRGVTDDPAGAPFQSCSWDRNDLRAGRLTNSAPPRPGA